MEDAFDTAQITVGVVSLGLIGSSIVDALAPLPADATSAPARIGQQLAHCGELGLLIRPFEDYWRQVTLTERYEDLGLPVN